MNVSELLATGKTVAKATGKVAYENRDVLADGARMGMDAKIKKNQDTEAKIRFRDYMQWRESGEDIEEFAFKRSELSGRPWQEIVENIKFHAARVQNGGNAATPVIKQREQLMQSHPQQKALPDKSRDIRAYLCYADVQETLGLQLTTDKDIPHDKLLEFADLIGEVKTQSTDWTSDYGRHIAKELRKIAEVDGATVRDISPNIRHLFNDAVSRLLIPNYMEAGEVIEKLCALDTRGEYQVISDKVLRALMIAYNSLN